MGKEQEYKEIFLAEANESYEQLNKLFTDLEKDINNKKAVDAIFRITHTLKGNAMGMGFTEIAELGHVMEDLFNEVKIGRLALDESIFSSLFKANDVLGELISAVQTPKPVKYKGIKTKLEVILRNSKGIPAVETKTPAAIDSIQPIIEATTEKKMEIVQEIKQELIPEPKENTSNDKTTENSQAEHPIASQTKEENLKQSLPVFVNENSVVASNQLADRSEHDNTEGEDDDESPKVGISDIVQVPVRKLDALLNIVGELLIEKDSLIAKYTDLGFKASDFARLHRITSDLQYGVMDVRLVQVGFLLNKFQRVVRDVAVIENKKVNLIIEGTEIEIDRNILKGISDSLVHMVRNSVSHGVESPEKRKALGKPETGTIKLSVRNEKDTVFIDVMDDGAGIDVLRIKQKALEKGMYSREFIANMSYDEALMIIFEPGFSNAEKITKVSGRGVGMDVVKRATESIGGKISIKTKVGEGSTFTLSLPSSMAVKGALLFELNKQEFAIPLSYTEAVISLRKKDLHKVNNGLISHYLGHTISIMFLKDLYESSNEFKYNLREEFSNNSYDKLDPNQKLDVVIVSYANRYVGLIVDKLVQQKEIVEKGLSSPVDKNSLFSGATILGNGNVCLVLDIVSILSSLYREVINQ